ncbi:MAG: hypothetical protein HRT37_11905 [Alteromonadaceae bacterium]|nr:hypothetical protein [Alteromonadaceae bacterium]
MMRFISVFNLLVSVLLISGCTVKDYNDENKLDLSGKDRLEIAIKQAKLQYDYRLFALKGRRTTLPGIENSQMENAKLACGIKYLKGTGDVLKNDKDREKRRLNFQFAEVFNQIIYPLCLKDKQHK